MLFWTEEVDNTSRNKGFKGIVDTGPRSGVDRQNVFDACDGAIGTLDLTSGTLWWSHQHAYFESVSSYTSHVPVVSDVTVGMAAGTSLYFYFVDGERLHRLTRRTDEVSMVTDGPLVALAAHGEDVAWATPEGDILVGDASDQAVVASGQLGVTRLLMDADHLYWIGNGADIGAGRQTPEHE